jgi:hypothetical protein
MQSSWEHLADEILFKPLDMADTRYRHADYQEATGRGNLHTRRRSVRINLCGTATSVRLDFYDETGLGTFTRG